jgi:Leucine-rich repeat (LRR) protein
MLSLAGNSITGSLPSDLRSLTALTTLSLNGNSFTGVLNSEITSLSNLLELRLFDNKLTGSIPTEIALLTALDTLQLNLNSFYGSLPREICFMSGLKDLRLYGNSLTNSIPTEIGLLTNLELLSLDNNSFVGSLPSEIGQCSSLEPGLRFSYNAFSGSLPSTIGLLSSIRLFHTNNNTLSGELPSEIGSMKNLATLNLSRNSLSGTLEGLSRLVDDSLTTLDVRGTNLSGTIPPSLCSLGFLYYCSGSLNCSTCLPSQTTTSWELYGSQCNIGPSNCIKSHVAAGNAGSQYKEGVVCRFKANLVGSLSVVFFDTERGYDKLFVKGEEFSGAKGPENVSVQEGDLLFWESDDGIVKGGFIVCLLSSNGT